MYLDIVLIDYLTADGVLTTYRITPGRSSDKVVIDRLSDIDMNFRGSDDVNLAGVRIYNSSDCTIRMQQARLRAFELSEAGDEISFTFEHMGIPVGSPRQAHGGFYNLVVAPGFRLTEVYLVDPYDKGHSRVARKKQFRHDVLWDTSCNTSVVTMSLISSRGTFSFIAEGKAKVYDPSTTKFYAHAQETTNALTRIFEHPIIPHAGRRILADDIAEKSEWLELKPNIMGIGINLNEIIKDSIRAFQNRMKSSN